MSAKPHFTVIDGEVRHAAAELKQQLPRITVALVLLDRVLHRLFRQAVLELECRNRQAIDEQAEIERVHRLVGAIPQLPRHAKPIRRVSLFGLCVSRRRRTVK